MRVRKLVDLHDKGTTLAVETAQDFKRIESARISVSVHFQAFVSLQVCRHPFKAKQRCSNDAVSKFPNIVALWPFFSMSIISCLNT